jgi:hypothetical protein
MRHNGRLYRLHVAQAQPRLAEKLLGLRWGFYEPLLKPKSYRLSADQPSGEIITASAFCFS